MTKATIKASSIHSRDPESENVDPLPKNSIGVVVAVVISGSSMWLPAEGVVLLSVVAGVWLSESTEGRFGL